MSLLRNAFRSSVSLRCANTPNRAFSSLLLRRFSTEAEHPPQAPAAAEKPAPAAAAKPAPKAAEKLAPDSATASPFPRPGSGVVYGRLTGISVSTLKTDILSLLRGCKLTPEDVRVDYNLIYSPAGMVIQFPSRRQYDIATAICRNGRLHRLEKADRRLWDVLKPYDGKTVCIKGLPQNATPDDIDRFLSGYEFVSNFQMFYRNATTRVALVQFLSQVQAMNVFVRKNGGFVLSSQVSVQVLQ